MDEKHQKQLNNEDIDRILSGGIDRMSADRNAEAEEDSGPAPVFEIPEGLETIPVSEPEELDFGFDDSDPFDEFGEDGPILSVRTLRDEFEEFKGPPDIPGDEDVRVAGEKRKKTPVKPSLADTRRLPKLNDSIIQAEKKRAMGDTQILPSLVDAMNVPAKQAREPVRTEPSGKEKEVPAKQKPVRGRGRNSFRKARRGAGLHGIPAAEQKPAEIRRPETSEEFWDAVDEIKRELGPKKVRTVAKTDERAPGREPEQAPQIPERKPEPERAPEVPERKPEPERTREVPERKPEPERAPEVPERKPEPERTPEVPERRSGKTADYVDRSEPAAGRKRRGPRAVRVEEDEQDLEDSPLHELEGSAVPGVKKQVVPDSGPAGLPPVFRRPSAAKPAPERQEKKRTPAEACDELGKRAPAAGYRLLAAALFCALNIFLCLYLHFEWHFLPAALGMRILSAVMTALFAATAMLAYDCLIDALKEALRLRFSVDAALCVMTAFVLIDSLVCIAEGQIPFCTAAGFLLVLALLDKYDGICALRRTMRTVRDAGEPTAMAESGDMQKGRRGLTTAKCSMDRFMHESAEKPATDTALRFYTLFAVLVSLVGGAVLVYFDFGAGYVRNCALLLLAGLSPACVVNYRHLFRLLAARLEKAGVALCGWTGARLFSGEHTVLVSDRDLFPLKNIKLTGTKFLTDDADRIVAYTEAAAAVADSPLAPLFEEELLCRGARHFTAGRWRVYDGGGIGAEVNGDIVLIGSLEFMRRMGIPVEGYKLRQAVYTSVNGELQAVFALKYTPKESVRRGLISIASDRHFRLVLITRDFLLTPAFVSEIYGVALVNAEYPPASERSRLYEEEAQAITGQGALLTNSSFGSFAEAAAGGRMLRSASVGSVMLAVFNGLFGLALTTVLLCLGGAPLTAFNLLLYLLIWTVPAILLAERTRFF